jgi:hypothetical protein
LRERLMSGTLKEREKAYFMRGLLVFGFKNTVNAPRSTTADAPSSMGDTARALSAV